MKGYLWAVLLLPLLSGCACKLEPADCWGLCGQKASDFSSDEKIIQQLKNHQQKPSKPLSGLDRALGILTTPLGKNLGLLGWVDLNKRVEVKGRVIQAAYSADQFYTVDMQIHTISLDGKQVQLVPDSTFIRAEICIHCVMLKEKNRPKAGHEVSIAGRLKWDADGFLEVHPQKTSDVKILNQKQHLVDVK